MTFYSLRITSPFTELTNPELLPNTIITLVFATIAKSSTPSPFISPIPETYEPNYSPTLPSIINPFPISPHIVELITFYFPLPIFPNITYAFPEFAIPPTTSPLAPTIQSSIPSPFTSPIKLQLTPNYIYYLIKLNTLATEELDLTIIS